MNISDGLYLATALLTFACLIYRPFKKYRRTQEHNIITFLTFDLFLTGLNSVLRAYLIITDSPFKIQIFDIESFIFFLLHSLLTPLFALYVMMVSGTAKNRSRRYYLRFWIPAIIAELLIFINPVFHFTYEITPDALYVRHQGVYLLYAIAAFYFVHAIISLVRSYRILNTKYLNGFGLFLYMAVSGVLIQAFIPNLQIESFIDTIALLGLMFTIDCNDGLKDQETKLPNKLAFKLNINLYRHYQYNYTVINIKLLNLSYYEHLLSRKTLSQTITSIVDKLELIADKCEIYRYNTETFIIIIPVKKESDSIVKALSDFFKNPVGNAKIELRTLISVAKVPEDIDKPTLHYQLAEYKPNNADKRNSILIGEDLEFLKRSVEIEAALNRAVKAKSFKVYYQPIWDNDSKKIISCEALCRLYDSQLGNIPPAEFIPIAEKTGDITAIGNIVFEEVCRNIQEHKFTDLGIKYVEVNLSLYQLLEKDLAEKFKAIIEKYNVPASMINLEITESSSILEAPEFTNVINNLGKLGFSFSLDDYGTAYSNITNVIAMKYLNVKIDASILWSSKKDQNTKILLDSTIKTFRKLGNNIVQEGVETQEQLDFITKAGGNLIQGYYFSKPLPCSEFIDFIKQYNK